MTRRSPISRQRSRLPRDLICAGFLLLLYRNVALAAQDTSTPPGNPPGGPDIVIILQKVEEQVAAGHAISPKDDCGMETWKQVPRLDMASPASPVIRAALENFVARMRSRSAEENSLGKLVVSSDFAAFADQAIHLLEHTPGPAPPSADGKPTPAADVLALDGHPRDSSAPNAAPPAKENEPDRTMFEPDTSAAGDAAGMDVAHAAIEPEAGPADNTASAETAQPMPPPPKRRHRHRPPPIVYTLPQTPAPPLPRPPLFARIFLWLSGTER
jgi:hypothetical protein